MASRLATADTPAYCMPLLPISIAVCHSVAVMFSAAVTQYIKAVAGTRPSSAHRPLAGHYHTKKLFTPAIRHIITPAMNTRWLVTIVSGTLLLLMAWLAWLRQVGEYTVGWLRLIQAWLAGMLVTAYATYVVAIYTSRQACLPRHGVVKGSMLALA